MPAHAQDTGKPTFMERLVPAVLAALAYLALPHLTADYARPAPHFQQLADAFLHGRLAIIIPAAPAAQPHAYDELIPAGPPDQYYGAYPPLPAVLLMPVVAVTREPASVAALCRLVGVLNVLLFSACVWRLPRRLGGPDFSPAARAALTVFFVLGTVCWHNAEMGGDWHLAHAIALAAMLLALREFLDRGRPVCIGGFVALALLARPTAALTAVCFILPLLRHRRYPDFVKLVAVPAIAVFLLALYNHARFGSPGDFGYDRMILQGSGRQLMDSYGQFHAHFLPRNAFWYFLAPPWTLPDGRFPYFGYDPRGLSLFIASPALLYTLVALRRFRQQPLIRDAFLGIVVCLIPLLLYFNTGFVQFGHRFSMDYLPLLLVLTVAGMAAGRSSVLPAANHTVSRPDTLPEIERVGLSRPASVLITASVLLQAWGVMLRPITLLPSWLAPGP